MYSFIALPNVMPHDWTFFLACHSVTMEINSYGVGAVNVLVWYFPSSPMPRERRTRQVPEGSCYAFAPPILYSFLRAMLILQFFQALQAVDDDIRLDREIAAQLTGCLCGFDLCDEVLHDADPAGRRQESVGTVGFDEWRQIAEPFKDQKAERIVMAAGERVDFVGDALELVVTVIAVIIKGIEGAIQGITKAHQDVCGRTAKAALPGSDGLGGVDLSGDCCQPVGQLFLREAPADADLTDI